MKPDDDLNLDPPDPSIAIKAVIALLTIFGVGVGIYELGMALILGWV
jgi:hypothetical protein